MSVKAKISKAFKNGRKVGYFLAMQNIKKSKPKLEISKPKDISIKKSKPKLEISKPKDISIKKSSRSKPKLEISKQKDISIKKSSRSKPKLEIEEQKDISIKGSPVVSEDVKKFLKLPIPSKKILTTEILPSINIESKILNNFDKNIQTEEKKKIDLILEDNINQQIIDEPFIQIREITKEIENDYVNNNYSYNDIYSGIEINGIKIKEIFEEPDFNKINAELEKQNDIIRKLEREGEDIIIEEDTDEDSYYEDSYYYEDFAGPDIEIIDLIN
jgi:hypothetical protein